jgi:hypothetical protein
MQMIRTMAIVLAALLLAEPAVASDRDKTAGELRSDCRDQDRGKWLYCYGYISGFCRIGAIRGHHLL